MIIIIIMNYRISQYTKKKFRSKGKIFIILRSTVNIFKNYVIFTRYFTYLKKYLYRFVFLFFFLTMSDQRREGRRKMFNKIISGSKSKGKQREAIRRCVTFSPDLTQDIPEYSERSQSSTDATIILENTTQNVTSK